MANWWISRMAIWIRPSSRNAPGGVNAGVRRYNNRRIGGFWLGLRQSLMRVLLSCACALLRLFAGLMGLVHGQAEKDLAWGGFLVPPKGCPMPCWQGIRPGVTTGEEAIAILQAHPWTRRV